MPRAFLIETLTQPLRQSHRDAERGPAACWPPPTCHPATSWGPKRGRPAGEALAIEAATRSQPRHGGGAAHSSARAAAPGRQEEEKAQEG